MRDSKKVKMFLYFLFCLIVALEYVVLGAATNDRQPSCKICKCNGTTVDCEGVKLDNVPKDFPPNITELSLARCGLVELKDNELGMLYKHLRRLDIRHNKIAALKNVTFAGLNELQYIDMGGNKYRADEVDPFVFSLLPNITEIIVRGYGDTRNHDIDRHVPRAWFDTFKGLENSTIERITFDAISESPVILKKEDFVYLNKSPVKYLSLYNIRLVDIDFEFLGNLIHLEEVDLSMNNLQMNIKYLNAITQLFKLKKLRNISLNDNSQNWNEKNERELLPKFIAEFPLPVPQSMEEINFARSILVRGPKRYLSYGFKIQRENAIRKVDVSGFKLMQRLGPVHGAVHVKELYAEDIGCEMYPSTFSCEYGALESIEIMNIAHNFINMTQNNVKQLGCSPTVADSNT
ncbi:unnamed protein product [Owenia fusiformis]|uniref:LRRNT domain-containing protein n=1 Tax=Owenia fusiformis TaxID=6347 RepID=A0A8S4N3M2_OWEFU|nr:unnamed protein product [Owenia fusiformis]